MLEQASLFTGCSIIQFLCRLPFQNIFSHDAFDTIPLTVQYLCDLQDAMPHYWSPGTSYPTLLRKTEDFPTRGKYRKDVPLPNPQLTCNQFNQ